MKLIYGVHSSSPLLSVTSIPRILPRKDIDGPGKLKFSICSNNIMNRIVTTEQKMESLNDISTQAALMNELAKRLDITNNNEWYKIPLLSFKKFGGNTLLSLYRNSLPDLLKAVYPEYLFLLLSLTVKFTPGIVLNSLIPSQSLEDIGIRFKIREHSWILLRRN